MAHPHPPPTHPALSHPPQDFDADEAEALEEEHEAEGELLDALAACLTR